MSADDCRSLRGDLAAFALDRADADERTRVLAHLDHCAECRLELDSLRGVVRALPFAQLDHVDTDHHPSADLVDRITGLARAERRDLRRSRYRRVVLAAGGLVAAAAIAVLAFVSVRDDDTTPALEPFAVAPAGAQATFGLAPNDQGTQIVFHQSGLDPSRTYWMWLTDADGKRYSAGTFRGAAHDETITMQSALPLADTVRIWCTGEDSEVVLDKWIDR